MASCLTGKVSDYSVPEKCGFIDCKTIKSRDPSFKMKFVKNVYFCASDISKQNPAASCASCAENEVVRFDLARNVESKHDYSDDLYAVNITGWFFECQILG